MTSVTELRALQVADLLREIAHQETLVVKLRMGVKMGMEKDSAKYVRERKQLARMKTVMSEKSQKDEKVQMLQKVQKSTSLSFEASAKEDAPSIKRSRKAS